MSHQIYNLKLNESFHDDNGNIYITRVPGGWLYYYAFRKSTVFVPYHDDLNEEKHKAEAAVMKQSMAAQAMMDSIPDSETWMLPW